MADLLKYTTLAEKVKKIPGTKWVYRKIGLPLLRFSLKINLILLGYKYNSNGLISDKNCQFINDNKFKRAYNAGIKQWPEVAGAEWTFHLNFWAIEHAKKLEGDFVECGVYRGKTSMANISYINFENIKDKKYYLFDTFQGLDPKFSSKDELDEWKGKYKDTYSFIKKSFSKYRNVKIIKGSVPDSLSKVSINKVSYLHVDMNSEIPEKEALRYFWPKMVSGGIIILDDYAGPDLENNTGLKRVHDDFAKSVDVEVLTFPGGQGVIIKP